MLKDVLKAMVPTLKGAAAFTGVMVCDQVIGRLTMGKPVTRAISDGIVNLAGGNRRLELPGGQS